MSTIEVLEQKATEYENQIKQLQQQIKSLTGASNKDVLEELSKIRQTVLEEKKEYEEILLKKDQEIEELKKTIEKKDYRIDILKRYVQQ